jgi:tetratricopeptide (TPR) repeat protein
MIVVPGEAEPWGRVFDLRVDDHEDPLGELRRLHALQRAYNLSEEAEALVAEGRHEEATALFQRAAALAPDNDELLFWSGLAAAQGGDLATALDRVRVAAGLNPRWLVLLERLEPEVAPAAAELRAALHKT